MILNKIKKIAFIIPTYPRDYNYARNLLKTFKKYSLDKQSDLFFVFTDESEAALFGKYKNKIILDKESRIFTNHGIINIKKFYALKHLQNKYEYFIVIDSESEFIRNVDIYSICEEIYNKKELYGNTVWGFEYTGIDFIRNRCKSYFQQHPQYAKLFEREKNLYLWFSNLPVYKSEYLSEFFSVINYDENFKLLNNFDFDHYIYMYYLILYHDFNVIDLKMHGYLGAGESMPEGYCFVPGTELKHNFNMCAKQSRDLWDNDSLFILIQLDRILTRLFWILGGTVNNLEIKLNKLEEELNKIKNKWY